MAITATFDADFSAFSRETQKAEADIRSFAGTTEKSLDAVTAAVDKTGASADQTGGRVLGLRESYSQFDNALNAAGIHIGQQIKAIDEIGQAAGKTASELGALGVAGLAVGAAMAGWEVGRKIAEFTGADKIIGNATAALLGWGDVAKETAAAGADAIALAFQRTGVQATNAAQALELNTKWVKEHNKAAKDAADAQKLWAAATAELSGITGTWQTRVDALSGTVVEGIKYYLQAGEAHKTIATAYGVSAQAIRDVDQSLKAETAAMAESARASEAAAKAIGAHWDAVGGILDDVFGIPQLKKATDWTDAIDAMGGSLATLSNVQLAQFRDAMLAGIDALAKSGNLTSAQSSRFAELATAADQALAALRPLVDESEAYAAAQYKEALASDAAALAAAKKADALTATATATKAAAAPLGGTIMAGAHDPLLDSEYYRQHLAGAQSTANVGMPYQEPAWVTMARQQQQQNITNNFQIVDTEANIARRVSDAITRSLTSGTQVRPV
jgi:hypothetical protein